MKQRILKALLAATFAVASVSAQAEDIDLFVNTNPNEADLPNVLFIIDNTANWQQAFSNEKSALVNTFNNLPSNKFRIGILFASETGDGNNIKTEGGYIRAAIRTMNDANKAKYAALIGNIDIGLDKANGGLDPLQFVEAYRYFTGGTPYGGNGKAKTDYAGNTCSECNYKNDPTALDANKAVYALAGNALSSKNATQYNSPIPSGSCAKNFIIYISNGANQADTNSNKAANDMLAAAGGSTTVIPLSPAGSQDDPVDEWARFLKESALGVTTYTIDVDPKTTGQGPGWTAVLKSIASVSKGKYTAVSSSTGSGSQISDAINRALSEIQSVNTVFASVSLPVSVNTQGTYLNQVFVGMFRPDATAAPRWAGNLKQYKLGFDGNTTTLKLKDADNNSAINNSTGFVTECARSFWTPTSPDGYWVFNPQGGCIPPSGSAADLYKNSNFPDGNVVEKGAQGYMLRSSTTRNIKTCAPIFTSCQNSLTDFNTGNTAITQSLLGASSSTERDGIINWGRGLDVDTERPGSTTSDMRPSVHGDIVHSRPVALNFGTDASPKVVVFYGGNDGVFRAVNGNRTTNIGTAAPGKELWSFMPPEFYGSLKRLRNNNPQINYRNITATDAQPKPYGVDGAVTAHYEGTNAWIYASMRRGGRVLYAFNVPASDPSNITLKWKRGCPNKTNDDNCSSDFDRIGQTWSQPKVLKASGYSAGNAPLLIMGGGYDPCEDGDPNTCGSSSKGNRIFVIDADNGSLQKSFTTDRGVIADVVVVPDSVTGLAKYAYTADLGGNVYRINIGTAAPSAWTMTKVASLGCATNATCTNNRKFMFAPDVVQDGSKYILLLGSGDREKPLNTYTGATSVTNYFFAIQDDPTNPTWLSSETACGGVLCLGSLLSIAYNSTTPPTTAELNAKKGWYLGLNRTEQVVTSAITIFGVVSFSTHEPQATQAGACSSALGTTRVYNINYRNAASENGTTSRFTPLPPVGLPPSPVAGLVALDSGEQVAFCIGCDPDSPLEAKQPTIPINITPTEPKSRVFWYLQQ